MLKFYLLLLLPMTLSSQMNLDFKFKEETGSVKYLFINGTTKEYIYLDFKEFGDDIMNLFSYKGDTNLFSNDLTYEIIKAYYSSDTSYNFRKGHRAEFKCLKANSFIFKKKTKDGALLEGMIFLHKNIPFDIRVSKKTKENITHMERLIVKTVYINSKRVVKNFNTKSLEEYMKIR